MTGHAEVARPASASEPGPLREAAWVRAAAPLGGGGAWGRSRGYWGGTRRPAGSCGEVSGKARRGDTAVDGVWSDR